MIKFIYPTPFQLIVLVKNNEDLKILRAQKLYGIDSRPKLQECSLQEYLKTNLTYGSGYPRIAVKKGIKGKVIISFYVTKEGKVKGSRIVKDIGGRCGNAALWIINRLNYKCEWLPGTYKGKKVDAPLGLPINFALY